MTERKVDVMDKAGKDASTLSDCPTLNASNAPDRRIEPLAAGSRRAKAALNAASVAKLVPKSELWLV